MYKRQFPTFCPTSFDSFQRYSYTVDAPLCTYDSTRKGQLKFTTQSGFNMIALSLIHIFREEQLKKAEAHLQQAVELAHSSGITLEELLEIVRLQYGE